MFSILDAAKAAAPATQPAAAVPKGRDMGAMGDMMGAAKGGFTGGTAKDKQMNSVMNFFTTSMNDMFSGMAPKHANGQPVTDDKKM